MEPVEKQVRSAAQATNAPAEQSAPPSPASPARTEPRRKSRAWEPPPAPAPLPRLDDYISIVGQPEIDEIKFLARELKGKKVKMVNSTAVGGGVAEMLNQLVPLLRELEVETHWDVITGGND